MLHFLITIGICEIFVFLIALLYFQGKCEKPKSLSDISKMRIIDPKQTGNVLHNISLSAASMELINSRLQELYLFNNDE